jgi:hypothetical protein
MYSVVRNIILSITSGGKHNYHCARTVDFSVSSLHLFFRNFRFYSDLIKSLLWFSTKLFFTALTKSFWKFLTRMPVSYPDCSLTGKAMWGGSAVCG